MQRHIFFSDKALFSIKRRPRGLAWKRGGPIADFSIRPPVYI
jgi:hypothetical protein